MRQAFKRCCLYKPVETFTKIFLPTFTGPNHLKSKLIYACHRGLVATPGEIMKIAKIILSLAAMGLSCAQAAPADDIRNLLEAGKHAEAYQMGRQHSSEFGQPVFDFYYGIAALDGGSPGEGVLALERFLLAAPANRSARFHLARGYYILGEDQRARAEFSEPAQNSAIFSKRLKAMSNSPSSVFLTPFAGANGATCQVPALMPNWASGATPISTPVQIPAMSQACRDLPFPRLALRHGKLTISQHWWSVPKAHYHSAPA